LKPNDPAATVVDAVEDATTAAAATTQTQTACLGTITKAAVAVAVARKYKCNLVTIKLMTNDIKLHAKWLNRRRGQQK